ncbi:unnamed protein product [Laminaria digitata]
MLAAARTCRRRRPLSGGARVPPAMAAHTRRQSDTTTSCSSTNVCRSRSSHHHLLCRALHSSPSATRAALQASSFRPHPAYAVLGPSLFSGRHNGSLRPWRRRLSIWSGSDQPPQRPGVFKTGAEGGGDALRGGPEELARQEQEVLKALSGVCEPCTGKGVVALGLVQDLLVRGEELLLLLLLLCVLSLAVLRLCA